MKKIWALVLSVVLMLSSVCTVYAEDENVITTSENVTEVGNQTDGKGILQYVVVSEPNIKCGDETKILVGMSEPSKIDGVSADVINEDTNEEITLYGQLEKDSFLFSGRIDNVGKYYVKSLSYTIDGNVYNITLSDCGIDACFGVDKEVDTTDADAYVVNQDESDECTSADEINDASLSTYVISDDGNLQETSDNIAQALSDVAEDDSQLAKCTSDGRFVVVLDPGHGGKDSGATSSFNGKSYIEKNLNLKIAQYCKAELEAYSNVDVYMTRNDDTFVELEDRVSFAKSKNADLFVSIHNNSIGNSGVHGATVYYPNSNYNANIGNQGANVAGKILNRLVALGLANEGTRIRNSESGDKYADGSLCDYYSVIRHSKMSGFPGIIVEHAYISNSSDAANYLGSDDSLKRLGVADATGIADYLGVSRTVYNGIDYSLVFDADYYLNRYSDLKAAFGSDKNAALNHFMTYGLKEGRQGRDCFNPVYYKNAYPDLANGYGNNWPEYYWHFIVAGIGEGRRGSEHYDPYSYIGYNSWLYNSYCKNGQYDFTGLYKYYIKEGHNSGQTASVNDSEYTVNFYNLSDNGQDNELVSQQRVKFGHAASSPELSKSGYMYSWDQNINVITSDLNVNAQWRPEEVTIYRLYNPISGEHLYTRDANEKNVLSSKHGWKYEGVGWYAPTSGKPVYRLYNPGLANHLYTTDTNEVNVLTSKYGWVKDNGGQPVFYSGGDVDIYRVYNYGLKGMHHLTTDRNEYNTLPKYGWKQDGVSFKALRR